MSLLEVTDLRVSFSTEDGVVKAVDGVSFKIDAGQTLGIVGESGSGKSVSTQTIMGLTRGAEITGTAMFEGRDLIAMSDEDLRSVRGSKIAMIFQDPLSSLHPHYKVGWQIVEAIRAHDDMSKEQARKRAVELLGLVGIPKPDRRIDDYPHQFSGGMRQRAMIAMALSLNPAVLIADEPTTALDVTVQAQILDLIERLQTEFGTAVIMITHDLGVVAELADEVLVMYGGKPVELSDRRTVYYRAHHPYTKGLLESIPSASGNKAERLTPIKGAPPSLITLPSGCSFHPRCPYVMDVCRIEVPPLKPVAGSDLHLSACHLPADEIGRSAAVEAARIATAEANRSGGTTPFELTGEPTDPPATTTTVRAAAKPAKTSVRASTGAVKLTSARPATKPASAAKPAPAPAKRAAAKPAAPAKPAAAAPAPAKRAATKPAAEKPAAPAKPAAKPAGAAKRATGTGTSKAATAANAAAAGKAAKTAKAAAASNGKATAGGRTTRTPASAPAEPAAPAKSTRPRKGTS